MAERAALVRYCLNRGTLVPPSGLLGTEHFDFDSNELASTVVGCNHLSCSRCRTRVVSHCEGLSRIYTCECTSFDAPTVFRLDEIDAVRSLPPWHCAGHTSMTLPATCDGVAFDDAMDVSSLVRSYQQRLPFLRALENPQGAGKTLDVWLERALTARRTSRRYCRNRGYVVPANGLVGPELFDFQFRSLTINVGCNHLRCANCKSPVQQRAGYTSDTHINRDVAKLAVAGDWQSFVGSAVALRDDARLYLCQCEAMTVTRVESLEPHPDDPYGARPWHCAGHPEIRVPAVLDGITLSNKTEFVSLARRYFSDELTTQPQIAQWHGDWLNRVFQLLLPGPIADQLATAVLSLIVDGDARVATRAITFFATNPETPIADELLVRLDADPAPFLRANPSRAGHDLRYWLLQSVGSRIKHVGPQSTLRPRAREIAEEGGDVPPYFLDALATS